MAFVIRRKLDLSDSGEGWEGAYIIYTPLSFSQNKKLIDIQKYREKLKSGDIETVTKVNNMTFEIAKDGFVEGKGYDGEKLVDITKENLNELPDDMLTKLFKLITGKLDTKKNELSPTSSLSEPQVTPQTNT